jgi:hypothetical protein
MFAAYRSKAVKYGVLDKWQSYTFDDQWFWAPRFAALTGTTVDGSR